MTTLQQYVNVLSSPKALFFDGHGTNHAPDRFVRLVLAGLSDGALGVVLFDDSDAHRWVLASGVTLALDGAHGVLSGNLGVGMSLTFNGHAAIGTLTIPYADAHGHQTAGSTFGVMLQQLAGPPGLPPTAPEAKPHTYSTPTGHLLTVAAAAGVLAGASDATPGAHGFAAHVFGPPAHGTLVLKANGSFTYKPAAGYAGPDAFTFSVTDSDGRKSALALATINVGFFVVNAPLPPAGLAAPYSANLKATGGKAPYTWKNLGTLPAGFKLSAQGVLSGTPSASDAVGSYSLKVQATDSSKPALKSQLTLPLLLT